MRVIASALLAAVVAAAPQTPPAPSRVDGQPVFRSGADLVRFDVRVTDDVAQMDVERAKGSFPEWPRFSELCTVRRKQSDQRILCAALGLALFDVVVATRVVQLAREHGIGRDLS